MGLVWIEQASGNRIHLPVQGDDVNTPDDIPVPSNLITAINRCWSQPITIVSPVYGSITIDLMQDSGLTGSCNQCGMCCGHPVANCPNPGGCGYVLNTDIDWHVCQYLDIKNKNKWGDAGNTTCTIYLDILDIYKGCVYPPLHIRSWMTGCGYSIV